MFYDSEWDLNELTERWLRLRQIADEAQRKADALGLILVNRFESAKVLGADTDTHRVTLGDSGTLNVVRLEDL